MFQLLLRLFLASAFWLTPLLGGETNSSTHYVSSQSHGQLGNQMFCIATTLAYAWDNNLTALFPFLNEPDLNRSYNRDHIFFRLDTSPCPKKLSVYKDNSIAYHPIPPKKDVFLRGTFFSWKHFHHHREAILDIFAPSDDVLNYLYEKYGDLIAREDTVAIHVRTTSKEDHTNHYPFPGLNYYGLAMEHFPKESLFVIFSDRINWCKKNFPERFPDRSFVFIEGNDHIEDLFLLSMMKHTIISNLTFSWWGAYLNTNSHQIVCAPAHQARYQKWPLEDYYLPEWRVIPYNFLNEPYPADMLLYDSTSIHNRGRI